MSDREYATLLSRPSLSIYNNEWIIRSFIETSKAIYNILILLVCVVIFTAFVSVA